MAEQDYRVEHDSMGELRVPQRALWGPQTQRAIENFPLSGLAMPRAFIRALGLVKWAAAGANGELGLLPSPKARAIQSAALEVAGGRHDAHFPVDVFQTGSGTSSNMNANEVIARLANRKSQVPIHPLDDVNMGQSSNDVVPTAIHVAAALLVTEELLPALAHLRKILEARATDTDNVVKTARTHLMDAMPIRLGQEISGWAAQIALAEARFGECMARLVRLAQGGTAVGTGINTHPRFGGKVAVLLGEQTGIAFAPTDNCVAAMSSQDTAVELSGQLRVLAVALMKIANDLRWMNSGPLAGLAEITLPALQPGSSIMPGKVNPVVPEAVAMVAAQVIGNDAAIAVAGQSGNFQLNVMLPLVAHNLLQSLQLLSRASRLLADKAVAGLQPNREHLAAAVDRNPMLVTAMTPVIGYEKGAVIARRAYAEGRSIREIAREETDLTDAELDRLLDALELTRGGIKG
ncbi:MAG: class II fumarate hydratase [Gammaproteobacteria bacterium]|nr:class II fumarate hydratase [Gammaproteobacteria bacterium]